MSEAMSTLPTPRLVLRSSPQSCTERLLVAEHILKGPSEEPGLMRHHHVLLHILPFPSKLSKLLLGLRQASEVTRGMPLLRPECHQMP